MSGRMQRRLRPPDRFPWVAVILGIAGFAVLLGLGTWQVNRLAWKEALLASIDQRTHAAPRPLAEIEKEFAHPAMSTIGRSQSAARSTMPGSGISSRPRTVSPASTSTRRWCCDGRRIFVNRGFVPYDNKDARRGPRAR